MDLKEAHILGDHAGSHWYYRSKLAAVRAYTRPLPYRRLLDVGAGSGFFSRALLADGQATEATCVDPSYETERNEAVQGKPLRFRRHASAADADLLLFMDVLEHVDDDVGLLREYTDAAPRGSHTLISVPAFSFLWSGHDAFLEHRRRYTLPQIRCVVERADLRVVGSSYYFGFVFPLALATRLAGRLTGAASDEPRSQLRTHSPLVNGVLAGVCRAELPLVRVNRLAGLTAFCLAHKDR